MKPLVLVLFLAAAAPAGDWALVAIRDNPKQEPDTKPARTVLTVDVFGPGRPLVSRQVTLHDAAMQRSLFNHPYVFPTRSDVAYLVVREGKGLRSVHLSWSRRESVGKSRRFTRPGLLARPRHLVTERIGFFTDRAMVSIDLRVGATVHTQLAAPPLDICPTLNRLYVSTRRGIGFHPVLAADPPEGVKVPAQPLFALPDKLRPERATVTEDGLVVAYTSKSPVRHRFLLSVADNRKRLMVRRSIPGVLHDLRWLDKDRLLLTTTRRETHYTHVLAVGQDRLTTTKLPVRYLAPPEIVPAVPLGLKRPGG